MEKAKRESDRNRGKTTDGHSLDGEPYGVMSKSVPPLM